MAEKKPKFEPNSIAIEHPEHDREVFEIGGPSAYMEYQEDGKSLLAIEINTDLTDEDSLAGGSEIMIKLWGIPLTPNALQDGTSEPVSPKVKPEWKKKGDFVAQFFAGEFFLVNDLQISLLGKKRVQVLMHAADIDEESDDPCTTITIDTQLMAKPAKLERPS